VPALLSPSRNVSWLTSVASVHNIYTAYRRRDLVWAALQPTPSIIRHVLGRRQARQHDRGQGEDDHEDILRPFNLGQLATIRGGDPIAVLDEASEDGKEASENVDLKPVPAAQARSMSHAGQCTSPSGSGGWDGSSSGAKPAWVALAKQLCQSSHVCQYTFCVGCNTSSFSETLIFLCGTN
jgi:hypothetical protein